jgi:hypothetical protein
MTLRELQRYVKKWKPLLRLQDWFVDVKIIDPNKDEDMADKAGQVQFHTGTFVATIEVNKNTPDAEATIAHELAHIQVYQIFAPLRAILEIASDDQVAIIATLLDDCEEQQVRHIEFLATKFI